MGDSVQVKFANASYNLINAASVGITPLNAPKFALLLRVLGNEIHWNTIRSQPLLVSVRDLNGRPVLQARTEIGSGTMRIPEKTKGIVFLSFMDPSTRKILWRDFLFL